MPAPASGESEPRMSHRYRCGKCRAVVLEAEMQKHIDAHAAAGVTQVTMNRIVEQGEKLDPAAPRIDKAVYKYR